MRTVLTAFVLSIALGASSGEAADSSATALAHSLAVAHGNSAGANPTFEAVTNGPLTIVTAGPSDGSGGGIYTVRKGGLGKRVFECGGSNRCWELEGATWSPDGKRLAYGVESIGGLAAYDGLYVLDLATGRSRQVRPFTSNENYWYEIAWSPAGNRIAYASGRWNGRGQRHIFVINADGTNRRLLDTGGAAAPGWPSWSPDGSRIAYVDTRPTKTAADGNVYVMRPDGTGRTRIASHGTAPAWSPDGTRIAYLTSCGIPPFRTTKPTGIRLVTPDGSDLTRATSGNGCSSIGVPGPPAWSPDGKKIAMATRQGVFVMDASGSNLTLVTVKAPTSVAANDLSWLRPAWRPRTAGRLDPPSSR